MLKRNKRILFTALSLLSVSAVISSIGATIAGFSASAKVMNNGIPSNGLICKTIYFNANIWEVDEPVYYMKRYNSSDGTKLLWVPVSKVITPRIGGVDFTMYIFQYDENIKVSSVSLDRFIFVRFNPSSSKLPSKLANLNTDLTPAEWASSDNVWNKSDVISADTKNYYCIEKWDESAANSYTSNILTYSAGTWTFTY